MTHYIKKCTCGIVIAQCKCASPDKTVTVVSPCEHNPSPTTIKECSQECISLHCKDTKNYPKSGHWSCKCSCHFSQPSEEKDQYGHKIIRPTLPDDTFDRLKEEIKERAKQEEWEKELELLFCKPWGTKEVKSFISQLLKKEREKVIEEVKKNTKDLTKYETEFTCPCGIEHSVQFLIRKPKVMKGKITEITINSEQLKK